MTDRELLELAAKAAGIDYIISGGQLWTTIEGSINKHTERWNPLANDGQALRLAVALEMLVHIENCFYVIVCKEDVSCVEHIGNDGKGCIYAATRRAIVCAAAEIGKELK